MMKPSPSESPDPAPEKMTKSDIDVNQYWPIPIVIQWKSMLLSPLFIEIIVTDDHLLSRRYLTCWCYLLAVTSKARFPFVDPDSMFDCPFDIRPWPTFILVDPHLHCSMLLFDHSFICCWYTTFIYLSRSFIWHLLFHSFVDRCCCCCWSISLDSVWVTRYVPPLGYLCTRIFVFTVCTHTFWVRLFRLRLFTFGSSFSAFR